MSYCATQAGLLKLKRLVSFRYIAPASRRRLTWQSHASSQPERTRHLTIDAKPWCDEERFGYSRRIPALPTLPVPG